MILGREGDLITPTRMAMCSWPLIKRRSRDPIYREVVPPLEEASRRLAASEGRSRERVAAGGALGRLLHAHAVPFTGGARSKDRAVVNEQIRPLLPEGTKLGADPALAVARTQLMSRVGTFLQIGHQRTAALAVCRQAAAINSQYASFPVADLTL